MARDERPRGLRARLRQRRTRSGSDDEAHSRPVSLDLDRRGLLSVTSVDARADTSLGGDSAEAAGGLALGEFSAVGGEVAEDEGHHHHAGQRRPRHRPSGAIERAASPERLSSDSRLRPASVRARRESSQSMPVYESSDRRASGRMHRPSRETMSGDYLRPRPRPGGDDDEEGGGGSGNGSANEDGDLSYDYTDEDDEDDDDDGALTQGEYDAEGELGAVYLKRNADFHALFRNIPINELLIEDYGCALQRDILVQGRLYLTESFVCFYSNIFGWVTTLVIAFDEIVSLEKRMTALIIPNAIQVSTLHAKHFFGSFIYRDSAFNQIYDLWAKSRNEKNAGLPEIGHAEGGGDAAGDVSRNHDDVLNAYQSLSEDGGKDDGARRVPGGADSDGADSDGSASGHSDTRGPWDQSRSGSESDESSGPDSAGASDARGGDSRAPSPARRRSPQSAERGLAAAAGARPTGGTPAPSDSGRDTSPPAKQPPPPPPLHAGGDLTPSSANEASSATPLTAADSAANSTIDVTTRGASDSSTARLLTRVPETSDGTPDAPKAGGGGPADAAALHRPTACPCGDHYSLEALDAVFPLSLPLLFRVVFSAAVPGDPWQAYLPEDTATRAALAESCTRRIRECGNSDVRTEGWVPDPSGVGLGMCIYSYERPLGFAIGPKSAMVEDTFRITARDFARAVVVEQVVRTPGVPSGTAFSVKVRHCMTWAAGPGGQPPGGCTRYLMTFEVEWTKSSWFKNSIEKGSADSNRQAGEQLEKYIREWVAAHPAMEVKATTATAAAAAAAPAPAHRRHRKAPRKPRREDSPRGLRMEELLGAAAAAPGLQKQRKPAPATAAAAAAAAAAEDAAALKPAPQPLLTPPALPPAQAAAQASGAAAALAGAWGRLAGLPQAMLVLALAVAVAVALTLRAAAPGGASMPGDYAQRMDEMRASIDALARQVAEVSRQVQALAEKQQR
ncbi:hypothetical protein H4R18_001442 [Coemansia javaensis]|uniref:VASt domain-containing protein n=1 Tax=Coemansia javaensis TaxID=2761396 RepID=A0A9W8LLC7_9FUNG|nr:hypothetical protein H4R18_001442 [Coemansia javaensis]